MRRYAIIALTNWFDGDIKSTVVGEYVTLEAAEAEWAAFKANAKANQSEFNRLYVFMDIHSGKMLGRLNNRLDLDLEVEV